MVCIVGVREGMQGRNCNEVLEMRGDSQGGVKQKRWGQTEKEFGDYACALRRTCEGHREQRNWGARCKGCDLTQKKERRMVEGEDVFAHRTVRRTAKGS